MSREGLEREGTQRFSPPRAAVETSRSGDWLCIVEYHDRMQPKHGKRLYRSHLWVKDLGRFEIVSDRTLSNDRRDTAAGSRDRQTHTTEAPFDEEETTNQVASEVGADGAGLSCPGSSVVADEDER